MEEPRASAGRYFCYSCQRHVQLMQEDFKCPLCSGGFIEQVDEDQPPAVSNETASNQNTHRPATTGQYTDIGIDELDDPPPPVNRSNSRWANWSPPWNYRDENTPPSANPQLSFGNDLAFLMSADRIHPESLIQQLMWQVTGGRAGVPPLLLVGHDPNDYVMSSEGLDAIMSQLLWHSDNDGPPPLASEIIENLPEITISEDQVLSNLQCSVCWELYNPDEKARQLKCGHIYHKECISPWLALHATCPICRQSLQPETSESEAGSSPSREPFVPNFGQNIRIGGNPPPSIAALLFRACRDQTSSQGGPATTATAPANPTPSSSVPFSPAPADAAPNTSATSEFSIFNNACDNSAPPTEPMSTNEPPTNQTTANPAPNQPNRIPGGMPPGINHIVLMASPQPGTDRNNVPEYSIAFWSNHPPLSSSAVSSTTSDVNSRRSPANFDMDLE